MDPPESGRFSYEQFSTAVFNPIFITHYKLLRPITFTYQTLVEAIDHIQPLPLVTLPGIEFQYGGLVMQIAGRMAELATGKEWETLFQEKIARPLKMTNIFFTPVDPAGGHNPMLGGGALRHQTKPAHHIWKSYLLDNSVPLDNDCSVFH